MEKDYGRKSEVSQATQTLQEKAVDLIRQEFKKSKGPDSWVIWWDDNGYLKEVVKEACSRLDLEFIEVEGLPLSLRRKALDKPKKRGVWYIPEGRKQRDWFLDIEETGGKIEKNLQELVASLYGGVQSWDVCQSGIDKESLENIAEVLLDELTQEGSLPSFKKLKSNVITKGGGRPLEYILKNGWGQIDRSSETVSQVCGLLKERDINGISSDDKIDEIVEKIRKWCIAQWLVSAGLDAQLLPEGYREIVSGEVRSFPLKKVIEANPYASLDQIYLQEYWPSVISDVEDLWKLVGCPVEGALESDLWQEWIERLQDNDFSFCKKQARRRYQTLSNLYPSNSAWVQTWNQAQHLSSLAEKFETWENLAKDKNLIELYTNEEGTWRIEKAVMHLIAMERPESSLPNEHPATESLPKQRDNLVKEQYLEYLERMSELTIDAFSSDSPLKGKKHAYRFWDKNREKLATGKNVAIFCIDALRFDLARELAVRLSDDGYEVAENTYIGCLPSKTKFGMNIITPGEPYRFKITMEDGELKPKKSGRSLISRREQILRDEGWEVTDSTEDGWEAPRVAYFDREIDKCGENEMDKIEQKLLTRVDYLHSLIKEKMEKGDWQRIFVVADHGFMLLPKGTSINGISPPKGASDINRRWIAGDKVGNDYGITLDKNTKGIGYLKSRIKLLVSPFQRFKKRGVSDSRYFHGGALPQEFILNFLEVKRK